MSAYGGYSRTSYGAGGGEDGGGFVYGSQGGSQSGAKASNDESLRPVTILQLNEAEQAYGDAPFRIDGVEIAQVTLVGMVRSISVQTTNITYRLDDGTGIVEVKQWLDADKAAAEDDNGGANQFQEEQYLRVYGRLKSFSNKRHVGAHVIKPVHDFNEVGYHLLEAAYVHLWFTKGGPPTAAGAGAGAGAGGHDDNDSMFVDGGGAADASRVPSLAGASARARKMYNYLNTTAASNEGINMHNIARDTGLSIQDVMAAGEELLSGGHVYTTLDDETFAILDSY
ncbi:replication protein A, subunit RPA32 [Xylariomycetidae sp. FL2044]|nr:replication protein A, subunit RPA32 [Xylariomycetidae sp. FL2044]